MISSAVHAPPTFACLPLPPADTDLDALADLLVDAVDSGAAVSFLAPLTHAHAAEWWRNSLAAASTSGAVILTARDQQGLAATVQLQPAWAPNQPHRAEVCKLIVHRRARSRGLATALMHAAEREALARGWTLLTLDARRDADAVHLYRKLGWTEVGTIPRYALNADRTAYHDTVIFYKEVAPPPPTPR
ncbi:MAG TPA: GNAT family N-acetyltransferase [Phycisphaerales bacterium]|nr:GNAT family N-acetyltransferase [Phycisphaerales bacterium]